MPIPEGAAIKEVTITLDEEFAEGAHWVMTVTYNSETSSEDVLFMESLEDCIEHLQVLHNQELRIRKAFYDV